MERSSIKCNFCQQVSSNLKRCSRCFGVYYCSKACQSIDWHVHRAVCITPPRRKIRSNLEFGASTSTNETPKTKEYNTAGERSDQAKEDNQQQTRDEIKSPSIQRQSPVSEMETGNTSNNAVKSVAVDSSDVDSEPQCASSRPKGAACTHCGVLGCEKKCSRCKQAVYCSRHCQQQDWTIHKQICKKKLSQEDERIMESYIRHKNAVERAKDFWPPHIVTFMGSPARFLQIPTLEQCMMKTTRPDGSLQAAVKEALDFFPGFKIVTNFSDVLQEQFFFFMPSPSSTYILVAFMYRLHEHVMRHGVYLKDDEDAESKVEFYLDDYDDNPDPFFSYQQVKPGGYICLVKPVMHRFMDGTVGIRVNHPHEAIILNI